LSAMLHKIHTTIRGLTQNVPEAFGSADFAMFKPRFIVEGENQFDCYHFVMPMVDVPSFIADDKKIDLPKNTVLATNPDQKLEVLPISARYICCEDVKFICLFMERCKLQELAKAELNRGNLMFQNNTSYFSNHLASLISKFETEFKNSQFGYQFILDCISTEIAITLIRELRSNMPVAPVLKKYSSRKDINAAIDYLWENTAEEFSMDTLCRITNLSPYYFIRLFKDLTGKTPYDYYMDIKMVKAMNYLRTRRYSITEICFLLGFSSHSHFSSVFRRRVGVTPKEYMSGG
jgi:AraC family transcriptional regulator